MPSDDHCGLTVEERAEIRRRALPAIAAYRDAGRVPHLLTTDVQMEMLSFLALEPLEGSIAGLMYEDMQFDGVDNREITWGDEIPDEVRAASPVVVIGCGLSGILAGIRLSQAGLPFTIVDKNDGPGGTWWENRYPGARVDVGSHQYCFAFESSDHWSEYYCRQPELRDYFVDIHRKFGLDPYCRFNTAVTSITWNEPHARWRVELRRPDRSLEVLDARFVISAVGSLNLPRIPEIPGMETFAGPSFHSAHWPDGLDLRRKRLALIGAGASGFQIAPTIADEVSHLTIYQRTAQWMFPNPLYRMAVPDGDRWALRHLPFYARWFRFLMTYTGVSTGTAPYRLDPDYPHEDGSAVNESNAARRVLLEGWIRSNLDGRADLIEKSIPDYPVMGKRILQDDGSWLRCLGRPNVELVRTGIEHVAPDGVVTVDGVKREADIICYATGFRPNDFLPPMRSPAAAGSRCRTSGATSRPWRTSASPSPTSPTCSASTGRAPTSPTARACSSTPSSRRAMRDAIRWRSPPARRPSRCEPMRTTAMQAGTSAKSASSCGRIRRSDTATTRTRQARCTRCRPGRSTSTGSSPARSGRRTPPPKDARKETLLQRPGLPGMGIDR